jgi:hypothetical protein
MLMPRETGRTNRDDIGGLAGDGIGHRQRRSHRRRLHAGNGGKAIDHALDELKSRRTVRILVVHPDGERQHVIGPVTAIGGQHQHEAACQQRRTDQQDKA